MGVIQKKMILFTNTTLSGMRSLASICIGFWKQITSEKEIFLNGHQNQALLFSLAISFLQKKKGKDQNYKVFFLAFIL